MTAHRRQAAATLLLGIAPLALLEGGLRLAGWPTDRVRSFGKLLDFDAQSFAAAIGVFRPGAHSTVMWPPELAYEVHINALGLRGPEISRTPPPGRTRILALGDSMTFGFYLGEGETWPARLEALLRAERRDVEVVNGGVGGWTISSETLFLEERALALAPAQVVVGFCANDIADLDLPAVVYERQKQAVAAGRGGIERALFTSALYELYLRAQVAWKHWRAQRSGVVSHPLTSVDLPPARADELWRVYAGWLDRMQRALSARGIGLTIVYLPDVYKLANGIPADDEARLRAIAAERGIGFATPLADFAGQPLERLFLRPLDDHLAPEGADRVARAVASVLARSIP
ncbi:MAG TPA: GDSL-type esterase/lipase family protein [Myxococcota bacterium]|nr:GDSL-type esterase/lipase family protein [Myxococcota bacterium]